MGEFTQCIVCKEYGCEKKNHRKCSNCGMRGHRRSTCTATTISELRDERDVPLSPLRRGSTAAYRQCELDLIVRVYRACSEIDEPNYPKSNMERLKTNVVAMAGPGVFNVTFGINETRLTQALDRLHYDQAEHMISDNAHSTYLDEGCYQRTPFYIVLCGKNEILNPAPRNLYLAKLLAENGADVNYRVPAMSMGAEYVDPGQSAVELVVDLFDDLTDQSEYRQDKLNDYRPPLLYEIVGLDGHRVMEYDQCVDQLLSLLLILLSHGGDLHVRDWYGMTPLHRTVVFSRDIRLTEVLTQWGADLNAQDVFGNTPLAALCEAFPLGLSQIADDDDDDEDEDWLDVLAVKASYQHGKEHFCTLLLEQRGIKLDVQNKYGCTALFNAVIRGDSTAAYQLLVRGADPCIKAQVIIEPKHTREISPLFASLFSMRVWALDHDVLALPDSHHFLAHLVDQDLFSRTEIVTELHNYIDTDFPAFRNLKLFGTDLLHMLFGGVSASLRQLSARAVFGHYISKHHSNAGFSEVVDSRITHHLLQELGLPHSSLIHIDIELLRLALFRKFSQFHRMKYENMEGLDDSDDSDGENDSDLEYW